MEIHKPKPIHSLRELASEIGVIVIGILIALGLEQAIETLHEREQTATAKEYIDDELRASLAKASVEVQMQQCSERQIAALSDAIGKGDQVELQRLLTASRFPLPFDWSDAAWRTTLASDAGNRLGERQKRLYSVFYYYVSAFKAKQERYIDSYGRLRAMALSGMSQSPAIAGAQVSELAEMSAALSDLQALAKIYMPTAKDKYGLEATPADFAVLPAMSQVTDCEAAAAALGPLPAP